MLTQKQENFKNDLFQGVPQRQAYINHYNTKNMLSDTIDKEAYELANNPKIARSLQELRDGVKSDLIANVEERKEKLTEVIRFKLPDRVTAKERVQATDTLNKMEKIYASVDPGYIDNRTINIIVSSERARELTERVANRLGGNNAPVKEEG